MFQHLSLESKSLPQEVLVHFMEQLAMCIADLEGLQGQQGMQGPEQI